MRRFNATNVSAKELRDANTFAIVLAEGPDGSGRRLELQKALSFDDQDRANGQDTYCLCTEEGATHYGGVTSWSIGTTSLKVSLDDAAATALGVEGFLVDFPGPSLSNLRAGLERLLGPSKREGAKRGGAKREGDR
jgi:hypothetical protein